MFRRKKPVELQPQSQPEAQPITEDIPLGLGADEVIFEAGDPVPPLPPAAPSVALDAWIHKACGHVKIVRPFPEDGTVRAMHLRHIRKCPLCGTTSPKSHWDYIPGALFTSEALYKTPPL